jgi:uncharacterized protein YndB with AHSA1/START domain
MKNIKSIVFITLLFFMTGIAFSQTNYSTPGWPPANILQKYGIAGMPQPAGANEISWRGDWETVSDPARNMTRGNPALRIGFKGTNATGAAIKNWFERNGWETTDNYFGATVAYRKGNAGAYYSYNAADNAGQIVSGVMPEVGRNSLLFGTWANQSNGQTLIFASDGWEWVEQFGDENYLYDGTNLKLTYTDYQTDKVQTTTTTVTISGNTLTIGRFSGGVYADHFNKELPGRYQKQ